MTTLLELVWVVSEITPDDDAVVATVLHMIESGTLKVRSDAALLELARRSHRDLGGSGAGRRVPTAAIADRLGPTKRAAGT